MFTLRAKLLLSLTLISAVLTSAVLLTVQLRVRIHVREEIAQALRDSVVTFRSVQQQREATLERSTALLATLPPLKAVMTSTDAATIQDASETFWKLAGSQVLVLADREGRVAALHTATPGVTIADAQAAIARYLTGGESRDWWFAGGDLFQIFLEPIYVGTAESGVPIGVVAAGYKIDADVAASATRVSSSQAGFGYEKMLIISTVPTAYRGALAAHIAKGPIGDGRLDEIRLGSERFLATSVRLSSHGSPLVTLTLLRSFDQATGFLRNLDRWIVVVGLVAVCAGSALVFLVSTTITRPLSRLVSGVHALERGDFAYPLDRRGSDEVSTLTTAFDGMRHTLQETQRQLLEAERLATIGRMASTISHDLRHPLTAVLAYAEFLSEPNVTDAQRKDFFEEIRIAVNRMMDEINSLLGFSKEREALRPAFDRVDVVIDRAIHAVKVLPEYQNTVITLTRKDDCVAWFDPAKLERVMLNLLFNAVEATSAAGRIEVTCGTSEIGTEIRVADTGPGIPAEIVDSLFQPFVSFGKKKGIGLGLTVVQNIMRQHHGDVVVERTGPDGTVFRLFFPSPLGADNPARASQN